MRNKKGFTLIELLAVIVILALIALIATPIVLNMINSARKSAAKSSALGYVDAIEYNNGFAEVDQPGYTMITGTKQVSELSGLKFKGKQPSSGNVTVDNDGKVTSAELCINDYKVEYTRPDVTNVTKGCDGSSESTIPTIDNCPGCKFVYTLNTLTIGTSTLPAGATDDYTTLTSIHPYFLGLITNSDTGVIEREFACGIENEKVFCLEGKSGNMNNNVNELDKFFSNCNYGTGNFSYECSGLSLFASTAGYGSASIQVNDDFNNRCEVSVSPYGDVSANCYEN